MEILFHLVQEPPTTLSFDAEDVVRLYWTAGVDLKLTEGPKIDFDPLKDPGNDYPDLVKRYKTYAAHAGHLIIGRKHPEFQPEVAGQLWDLESRGVAAVYTYSSYIDRFESRGLLQTAAHEIGHMLNLGHRHVVSEFTSTMDSADHRDPAATDVVAKAWELAAIEAEPLKEPYFKALNGPHACYPLPYAARLELNKMADDQLIPWRQKFEYPNDTNDACRCFARE